MRLSVFTSILLFAFVGAVGGCSGSERLTYDGPKEAYTKGISQFEEGDYKLAVRFFRGVLEYGRGNKWAANAQYKLAMAQRKRGKHLVAASEFKRFTEIYRNSAKVAEAQFERANSYYLRSPMYRLDQSDSRQAISLFQLFIDQHPNHRLVPEAEKKIDELRAKLAHKKYAAAQLYEQREMWQAATEVYVDAFNKYPDTKWADEVLLGAVRSYVQYADRSIQKKQAERYRKAIKYYNRLTQLFPESKLLSRAEELYSEAQRKLERVQAQEDEQSLARDGGSRGSR
ncbi:MAG: outer membrane protein assembly factor BamD [Salinibacter sp.]|uniref:outer membrane protein assembly factor BamD n=1 Tax=Salinibacter sp. TaxID=2065818 RepID=UPI0035D4F5DE